MEKYVTPTASLVNTDSIDVLTSSGIYLPEVPISDKGIELPEVPISSGSLPTF